MNWWMVARTMLAMKVVLYLTAVWVTILLVCWKAWRVR